nr:MAG TPA: hypothetical protein [Caudoviricetes sp.]
MVCVSFFNFFLDFFPLNFYTVAIEVIKQLNNLPLKIC